MAIIAKIIRSDGTQGDLLINAPAEDLSTSEPVFVTFDGLPVPFFIESIKPRGRRSIVHITGVDSLRDAEEIVGRDICDGEADDSDEEEDFIGWTLFDKDVRIGTITGLELIPGNPCLNVEGTLVPRHEDLILEADPEQQRLVMDLPEGLL
jgi:ribosomal 30S subunit maturation factor RimM